MHKKILCRVTGNMLTLFLSVSLIKSYVFALHNSKVNCSLYRNRESLAGKKPHGIRINGLIPWGSITRQQTAVSK